jgi:hypothetical protein
MYTFCSYFSLYTRDANLRAVAGDDNVDRLAGNDTFDMTNAGADGSFVDLNSGVAISGATRIDCLTSTGCRQYAGRCQRRHLPLPRQATIQRAEAPDTYESVPPPHLDAADTPAARVR